MLSNSDGAVVSSGPDLLRRLFDQVAAPVRWDLCMKSLGQLGVNAVIELTPGGTLTGLVRRALPGVELLAVKTPDDLACRPRHDRRPQAGHPRSGAGLAHRRLPRRRPVRARPTSPSTPRSPPGGVVGVIEGRGRQDEVVAPYGGVLVEWLAEAHDPVNIGQPLVRFHPAEAHQ